jgi:hypothetical protein
MAKAYPNAPRDLLNLASDVFTWLTAFDDTHAETTGRSDLTQLARTLAQQTDVLDTAGHGHSGGEDKDELTPGFPQALADLTTRARRLLPHEDFIRLLSALRGVFFALLWEAHVPWDENSVTLDEYLTMRRHTVFATVLAALVPSPPPASQSPDTHRLEASVLNLVGWINDLLSFSCEHGPGRTTPANPLSLPHLLMREKNRTQEEALTHLVHMCEEEADVAHRLIVRLTSTGDKDLHAWAEAMAHLVAATDWHITVQRYQQPTTTDGRARD